jgi:hypothetical protein
MGALGAFARGYEHGGIVGGLADAMGARAPLEVENLNATTQALISKGVPPELARAAALNPALAQQVIGQAFKLPEFTDVGNDQLTGLPIKGWANPVNQSVTQANVQGAQGSTLAGPGGAQDVTKLLQTNPLLASDVRAYVEGREMPTGRPQHWQQMVRTIGAMMGADETTFQARAALRKSMQGYGKGGQEATAANTGIEHLRELSDYASELKNFGGAWLLNKPLNELQGAYRWLTGDQRPTNFNALRDLAVGELEKFYTGSGASAGEREAMKENIKNTGTPQQLQGAIAAAVTAMTGKIKPLEENWRRTMGASVAPLEVLEPESKAAADMIRQRAGLPPLFGQQAPSGGGLAMKMAVEAEMKRRGLL